METLDFTVALPEFKEEIYHIVEFGAVPGGIALNSEPLQKAIDVAASHGGGHVLVPRGIWLTGPVELKSGVDLHLAEGALLLFDKSKEANPLHITDYEGTRRIRAVSPIHASHARDIGITGKGIMDGNGHLWRMAKEFKFTSREWEEKRSISPDTFLSTEEGEVWYPTRTAFEGFLRGEPDLTKLDDATALEMAAPYYDYYRPVMVELTHCSRILIEGVTLQNSPAWNLHPLFCDNLTLRDAWIRNDASAQNGDGLDLESCKFVEIDRVSFDVGDDAICMKAGKNAEARKIEGPTEKIYIHDCTVYRGHGGFVVGSEMSRGVRHILVERCTFIGTDIGIRFKTAVGRGGVVEDITIRDINMVRIPGEAILFTMGYVFKTVKNGGLCEEEAGDAEGCLPEFKNISISRIFGRDIGWGIRIDGLAEMPVHDICISDVYLDAKNGVEMVNGDNVFLENVDVQVRGRLSH